MSIYSDRFPDDEQISLCETLDRVLNKGVVVVGDVVISVAEVDLIFVGLHVILTSLETARGVTSAPHSPNLAGGA